MHKPTDFERSLILLCKGHHNKEEDTLTALKKYLSEWSGIDYEHVRLRNLYDFLSEILVKYSSQYELTEFFKGLFDWQSEHNIQSIVERLVGKIAVIRVIDSNGNKLIDLDGGIKL